MVSQKATTWAELLQDDELKQGMDIGDLFYGFQEGKIRLPPSYRRAKGLTGECGDYTDAGELKKAFSTAVKEKSRPLHSLNRGLTHKLYRGLDNFGHSKKHMLQQEQQEQQEQVYTSKGISFDTSLVESCRVDSSLRSLEVEGEVVVGAGGGVGGLEGGRGDMSSVTTRATTGMTMTTPNYSGNSSTRISAPIPSYTDRMLLHVVEDFRDRLSLGPYEICDALVHSDHRPVSTLVTARVNVSVRGLNAFQQASEILHDPTVVQGRDIVTVHDACFYLLELTDVRVELFAGGLTGCKLEEEEEAEEVEEEAVTLSRWGKESLLEIQQAYLSFSPLIMRTLFQSSVVLPSSHLCQNTSFSSHPESCITRSISFRSAAMAPRRNSG